MYRLWRRRGAFDALGLASLQDMKVLSEFFLKDSTFIGGEAPDISDCYICMQLLLLYSTDFPPQNQGPPPSLSAGGGSRGAQIKCIVTDRKVNWRDGCLCMFRFSKSRFFCFVNYQTLSMMRLRTPTPCIF